VFRRVVDGVEYVVAALAVVTVGLLLFYKPSGVGTYNPAAAASSTSASDSASGSGSPPASGAVIYSAHCSGCHGSKGEGSIGPKLGGGAVAKKYANQSDEIAVVTAGRGSMPAWGGTLSPAEIAAVVAYTRSGLG
jgi:cytochrome c oxidase subunit 2